jgi:hypothetical protein
MNKSIENWMKEWTDLINQTEDPSKDFWIETPIGNFKNPKFIPNNNEEINEINITIKYDEWENKF